MSTRKPTLDPMAQREAEKYEFPVPSREAVLELLAKKAQPLSFEAIAQSLEVRSERDRDAFARRLRAMERDGQILQNRRELYGLPKKMDMVRGYVSGHTDGFGFLIPEEGSGDLFLSPREMRQVLHGDRILARVMRIDSRGRREGAVVTVLERAHKTVVGRFVRNDRLGFVVPADKRIGQDIQIPLGDESGASENQIVVAEVQQQPTLRTGPVGRIVEVLGEHMAPGMEIEVAIRAHNIPNLWPGDVLDEAKRLPTEVLPDAWHGREDLRHLPLVTIDGEDARDFDDAVYCESRGKYWRLLVAIADVSSYVTVGSALDREAYQRGTSVYFPQHVIPMLPEALSNGLCSLNPNVDRLCMVCEAHIGPRGEVKNARFFEGVMRSVARLTYTEVAAVLVANDETARNKHEALIPQLEALYELYKILHAARIRRGAIDFDLPETRIIYDEHRKIKKIVPIERNDAHRLIEECMLTANVCAADLLKKHKMPALYRIHDGPTFEKLTELREFLFELGLSLRGGDSPSASDYAKLKEAVEGRPDFRLIQTVLLRSLSQALYSPDNNGHFALSYEQYTHFTSPIRRYPDLLVHRAIKDILQRRPPSVSNEFVKQQGEHCSMTERRADEATRDVIRWLKAEYMMDRIGEEFEGIISGVTNFGIFVELSEVFVDGLVHVTALGNDYYHFDPAKHRLLGERTRRIFRLGDQVRVRVMRVDLDETKIDFELVDGQLPLRKEKKRTNLKRSEKRDTKRARKRSKQARKR